MHELLKVTRREAPQDAESAPSTPAPSVLGQALRDARSLLPSSDPAENGRFKLGLYLGWGVPVWYAIASTKANFAAYSFVRHAKSGHCSGEHNF